MEKYDNFIKEAMKSKIKKPSFAKVGDFVLCNGIFNDILGTSGKIAEITKIDDESLKKGYYTTAPVYTLKFNEPVEVAVYINKRGYYGNWEQKKEWEKTDTLTFPLNMLNGLYAGFPVVEIIPAEYVERFKRGEITKYKSSDLFTSLLKQIKFNVKEDYYDASYFDVDREKEDLFSFIPITKIKELKNIINEDEIYRSRYRQSSKIGRVFKKLNDELTDVQIENFVNEYKAAWKAKMEDLENRLRVVTGDDIVYWYLNTRYAKGNGTLNASCMQGPGAQNQIKFYAQNPNCIALAILLDDNDKLLARALIWRCIEPEGVIFMDRIYSVNPEHAKILHNFAKDNGIMTKADGYNTKHKMKVKIKPPSSGSWPYLDTFVYNSGGKDKNVLVSA